MKLPAVIGESDVLKFLTLFAKLERECMVRCIKLGIKTPVGEDLFSFQSICDIVLCMCFVFCSKEIDDVMRHKMALVFILSEWMSDSLNMQ